MKKVIRVLETIGETVRWLLLNPFFRIASDRIDFFAVEKLVRLKFVRNPFMIPENSFYGHARIVKRIGGKTYGSKIEHGVFFAEGTEDLEFAFTPFKRILYRIKRVYTFSARRKRQIEQFLQSIKVTGVSVIALGPYVKYAKHFLRQEELVKIKQKLGRVLLVYPVHTIESVTGKYDTKLFLDKIENMRSSYDTVLISMYWMDVLRGVAAEYEKAGCIIVTAGRREDPNFMSRQKDLLSLADRVLSNSVGTHIGYAITMNVPCTLFRQNISLSAKDQFAKWTIENWEKNTNQFFQAFESEAGKISHLQRQLVEEFWG